MIGDRIRELIDILGLNQYTFAEEINISRSNITKYISGQLIPNQRIIQLIEEHFKVRKEWLETGEGSVFIDEMSPVKQKLMSKIVSIDDEQAIVLMTLVDYFLCKGK